MHSQARARQHTTLDDKSRSARLTYHVLTRLRALASDAFIVLKSALILVEVVVTAQKNKQTHRVAVHGRRDEDDPCKGINNAYVAKAYVCVLVESATSSTHSGHAGGSTAFTRHFCPRAC